MICGGETSDTILGTCGESEVEQKRREIERSNRVEAGPNIRGIVRPQESFWFVRPASSEMNNPDTPK